MQHVAYGDPVAGLFGAIACLAALYARAAPRAATWIDLSQVECLFQLGADAIVAQSVQRDPLPREGSAHPASLLRTCVSGVEPDTWLAVSIETLAQLEAAGQVVGDGSDTPLEVVLPAWSAVRSVDDAASALQQAGVPAAPVRPSHALLLDRQLSAAGFWESLDRAFVGRHVAPRPPIRLDGESPSLKRPAPTLGQHNAEVLAALGLSDADIAALREQRVIGERIAFD
jgi:crotonobetainyl-CoA:carnitine CoA-transferase CaiB-like acyl-CoA transferase